MSGALQASKHLIYATTELKTQNCIYNMKIYNMNKSFKLYIIYIPTKTHKYWDDAGENFLTTKHTLLD